jgi:uncharacterized protein DUF6399
MGFWAKSRGICKCLCDHGKQSVRRIAQQTGFSKSSVHRLKRAMARRGDHAESWLWETEEGRRWLTRLVVATLYIFGLKRGVGVDTISEFFARLRLDMQVGCSPSALRGVMQRLEAAVLEAAQTWERDGTTHGEVRDIIGAVDETFLEHLMLVFQDVSTGYLLLETVAEDRTYATWKAAVDQRLAELGTGVLYLVSDRAKALIQLAEQGLECLSMPDFFHLVHEIVKSYSLAMGRRLRQARQDLTHAEEVLARHGARAHTVPHSPDAQAHVEAKRAEVQQWEDVQRTYRHHLETLSLTLHPFGIADSVPQTSAQVARQLHTEVEAIEALAHRHQLPARHDAMKKVRTQLPALAALVDFWWQGVRQDLEPFALSPQWGQWVHTCLLPMMYWDHQVARTRCRRRKARIRQALEAVRTAFERHPLTLRLAPHVLAAWQGWAVDRVKSFQRTSSAVEGRNGFLSQMQHNQRGLPKQRYKVWAVLHNFDGRAADGTTPAVRFFRRTFPDLFETVLSHIEVLPRARQRKDEVALCH